MRRVKVLAVAVGLVLACDGVKGGNGTPGAGSASSAQTPVGDVLPAAARAAITPLGCRSVTAIDAREGGSRQVKEHLDALKGAGVDPTMMTVSCDAVPERKAPTCDAVAHGYAGSLPANAMSFAVTVTAGESLTCFRMYRPNGVLEMDLKTGESNLEILPLGAAEVMLAGDGSASVKLRDNAPCALAVDVLEGPAAAARETAIAGCFAAGPARSLYVRAAAPVPFSRVLAIASAASKGGPALPIALGPPLDGPWVTCDDEQLAGVAPSPPAGSEEAIIVLSKTALLLGDRAEPVALVPADKHAGFDASAKRCGRGDYHLEPLAAALPASATRIVIVADPSTPFRLLWEAYYTAHRKLRARASITGMKAAP